MTKLFGTDGMRGEAGKFPFDVATMRTVGASLSVHLEKKISHAPIIVTGRDTRESGQVLEQSLIEGAVGAGAVCKSAGVITTPGIAFLTRTIPADAGIVISASHNAYRDNGVKIFATSGKKLDEETERLIETDVFDKGKLDSASTETRPSMRLQHEDASLRAQYLDFLVLQIGHDLSLANLRLVLDCANGAASKIAPELFERLGAKVTAINDKPDGRNINLGCGSLHMEGLWQAVLDESADLGVAFDGDADRALFVDAKGRLVNGDASLWVFARYLDARNQLRDGLVVATVMSNIGLEIALSSQGLQLIRTDVGDKYVLDELLRLGASLGGEQSGHIIFPELSLAGDGLITTLCMLRAIREEGKPLHELTEGFVDYPQILLNVEVREKRPFAEIEGLNELAAKTEARLGSTGRLLLRYSGTESLARVMVEGASRREIEEYANSLAGVIREQVGR